MSKEYYSDKSRVSNSGIGDFLKSPLTYKKKLDGDIVLSAPYLTFGRALHCYILEPELFWKEFVIKDYDSPTVKQQKDFCSKFISYKSGNIRSKIAKAYRAAYATKGKTDDAIYIASRDVFLKFKTFIKIQLSSDSREVITWNDYRRIQELTDKATKHELANDLLMMKGECEMHINWEMDEVDCKSLIDKFVVDKANKIIKIVDLKTTVSISKFATGSDCSILKYGYRRQMMFYSLAALYYLQHVELEDVSDYKFEAYLIALETGEIPSCEVFYLSEKELEKEFNIIGKAVQDIFWHKENNLWEHSKEYYEGLKYIPVELP